jgi:hypothetical protein
MLCAKTASLILAVHVYLKIRRGRREGKIALAGEKNVEFWIRNEWSPRIPRENEKNVAQTLEMHAEWIIIRERRGSPEERACC